MSLLLVVALVGCGTKTESKPAAAADEALKAKARGLRDMARACKDRACVAAVSASYMKLTADLRMEDAAVDTDFFVNTMGEIRDIELKLEAVAAAPARTKAAGFSVVLPPGWETRRKLGVVLGAAHGDTVDTITTLAVLRGDKPAAFETEAACSARGAEQAEALQHKFESAKIFTLAGATVCIIGLTKDAKQSIITLIPVGKTEMFYVMCGGVIDAKVSKACMKILVSWKFEA